MNQRCDLEVKGPFQAVVKTVQGEERIDHFVTNINKVDFKQGNFSYLVIDMQTEQQETYKSNICVFLLEIHIF